MSYSFDMDGWELFNSPFSPSVNTAQAPAGHSQQQQPTEAAQRNTAPTAAQRNSSPAKAQKNPQPARQATQPQQQPAVKQPEPTPEPADPASDKKPAPKAVTPATVQTAPKKKEPADSTKSPADTTPALPQKELVLDMSSGSGAAPVQDDTERRKAHEVAEAKRKAEFDERQRAKKQAEETALQKLNAMSDADIIAAAARRISTDTERLTRRNMKECVAEHIQSLCKTDTAFGRKVMHPRKTMIRCFKYINRMARDFVKQEMEDNDIKPDANGYGCDVPDGLVYQWAEDYFNAVDAPEDQEKEEKFTPKPYVGTPSKTAKQTGKKPKTQEQKNNFQQMSLF